MAFNQGDAINQLAEILLEFEGECLKPYRCSAGVPTIGVGATTYPDGRKVTMQDPAISQEESRDMLMEECGKYLRSVQKMLTWEATQNQLVAMCSLSYNIGIEAFRKSTVLRTHNEGNFLAASRAFGLWNKAKVNGKLQEVRGLTSRRATESALYLRADPSPFKEAPVQAVSQESSLAKSPINVTGVSSVVAGGATLTTQLFADTMPMVEHAKNMATSLNINPLMVLGIAILTGGVVAMYFRYKQRADGWA